MRILIEEYQYEYEDVYDVLKGLGVLWKSHTNLTHAGKVF